MAVTFAQAAALETDQVKRGALQTSMAVSTVWDRLHFELIQGNAYAYDKEKVLPGTGFRSVNEGYVESTGLVNGDVETLSILGGDADVDNFLIKTMQSSKEVLLAGQIKMKLESAQSTYVDAMFNGDATVNPKGFDGLRKRLIGAQVIDAQNSVTDDLFLSDLDALLAACNADVVYANKATIAKLKGLGRKLGGFDYVNSEITGKREFTWNGVSFSDPGKHWGGSDILDGSDMYAVKLASSFTDEGVMGIANGMLNCYVIGELESKPATRARIDFYAGLVAQGGGAAARLRLKA